jgi:hypothetical protein
MSTSVYTGLNQIYVRYRSLSGQRLSERTVLLLCRYVFQRWCAIHKGFVSSACQLQIVYKATTQYYVTFPLQYNIIMTNLVVYWSELLTSGHEV